jgi:nucleotide-binding universal stress UspA family protein
MIYRDIVVQIDRAEARARYEAAAALAARFKGRLRGVYLKTSLINQYNSIDPIAWLPPESLNQLVREHNAAQDKAADASGAALIEIAKRLGADADWEVVSGDTPDALVALARCADLVVLPPPTPFAAYSVHASAVAVGMAGGGPVLIVPEGASPAIGARALVAWNGGREAARALRDALPLLAEGAAVEVRIAHPDPEVGDPAQGLRRRLAGLGLKVNVVVATHPEERISDWIRDEAKRTGCDLIVMGLYGHTRMREFVLGGVSRGMLHDPPLPVLISH